MLAQTKNKIGYPQKTAANQAFAVSGNCEMAFWAARIPSASARLLVLGCGAGRNLVSLSALCAKVHAIDSDGSEVEMAGERIIANSIGNTSVEQADFVNFRLPRIFDLVIVQPKILEKLCSYPQIAGLFKCIREHLAPWGTCVIVAYNLCAKGVGFEPKQFERLIAGHGFKILDRWGGYNGEPYGAGPELIVQFA